MRVSQFRQVVWDYNMTQEEFEALLFGEKEMGTLNQEWAIARVLENLTYYEAMELVPRETMRRNWNGVKKRLFKKNIRDGYEFLLQRYPVSVAG